ncbi:hypothetical protein Dsin_025716 [Dipteronia sinensis]|uniref:Ubiquitin-like protease family profile domain-containing protein n=1 Tax=Dipteronia sinensis TaxID=43782 RepID=A0AAD9ZWW5_9ROSI|nr:hypothetical protein Dsin_025716 [Dipteronia sinensis]
MRTCKRLRTDQRELMAENQDRAENENVTENVNPPEAENLPEMGNVPENEYVQETENVPQNENVIETEEASENGDLDQYLVHSRNTWAYDIMITMHCKLKLIDEIKTVLADYGELDDFKKSCFGHYLDMTHYMRGLFQAQYIHNLLLRQIRFPSANDDEMWFALGKTKRNLREASPPRHTTGEDSDRRTTRDNSDRHDMSPPLFSDHGIPLEDPHSLVHHPSSGDNQRTPSPTHQRPPSPTRQRPPYHRTRVRPILQFQINYLTRCASSYVRVQKAMESKFAKFRADFFKMFSNQPNFQRPLLEPFYPKDFEVPTNLIINAIGQKPAWGTPWANVDDVLVSCNVGDSHWALCVVCLNDWVITIFDSVAHLQPNYPKYREQQVLPLRRDIFANSLHFH